MTNSFDWGKRSMQDDPRAPVEVHKNVFDVFTKSTEKGLDGIPYSAGNRRQFGFTLIELMIVMAIVVILIGIAVPYYQKSILRARESVLRNNLFTLRQVIDEYTYDHQKAPQGLTDLVAWTLPAQHPHRSHDILECVMGDHSGGSQLRRQPE